MIFYDVGLVSKHTHLEYCVFVKNTVLFVFSFNKFYFGFEQPVHFHFNPSNKPKFFLDNMYLDLTI